MIVKGIIFYNFFKMDQVYMCEVGVMGDRPPCWSAPVPLVKVQHDKYHFRYTCLNLGEILMHIRNVKAKLQANSYKVCGYNPEKKMVNVLYPTFSDIVIHIVDQDYWDRPPYEIHFSDLSIQEEWKKAGEDTSLGLPLTGKMSSKMILELFKYIFDMCLYLGLGGYSTSCRCDKRRRVYILAAKRLGVEVKEDGEDLIFTM